MRKMNRLMLLMALSILAFGIVSCSEDDDDKKVIDSPIIGTYVGNVAMIEVGEDPGVLAENVELALTSSGTADKVNVALVIAISEGMKVDVKGKLDVTTSGTSHNLKGTIPVSVLGMSLNAIIDGTVAADGKIKVNIAVLVIEENMKFVYTGTKKK